MESLTKFNKPNYPLNLSLHHRPSFTKPISSFSLKAPSKTKLILRASFSSSSSVPPSPNPQTHHKKPSFETLKPLSSLLKTTCVAIFSTSLFLARFSKPSIAAPIRKPIVQMTEDRNESIENVEKEKLVEDDLDFISDVKELKALMETKVKDKKFPEAISILDRIIEIQPSVMEWPLLRAHLRTYGGEVELAKLGFEEILTKDPLFVEAYHGLVMAASQSETDDLEDVLKRIENAMEICKKEKKKDDLRDFKLLVAQVKVIDGNYTAALKIYQELVKEEPRDFRPYLCQGIIYTLLRKKNEAEKQFEKYRKLVPKEHPYARYFEDNMLATKVFSQMAEKETAGSKR